MAPHQDHNEGGSKPESLFENEDTDNDAVWLCACTFMSALFMFSLETILPLLKSNSHHHHHHHHQHGHSHHQQQKPVVEKPTDPKALEIAIGDMEMSKRVEEAIEQADMLVNSNIKKKSKLSPVAFMVILGDGLHNITDGMAIGAAFALDPVTGLATAFAVLCHELPHELGDFALLLQTGVSIKKAMLFNFYSSILSVMGMVLGLVIAGIETSFVRWIYAGTAGTFLYIALADLVPEMRNGHFENQRTAIVSVMINVAGIFIGGIIMLTIALYEHKIRLLFE